jgi:uncharacterized protein with HEPN domain
MQIPRYARNDRVSRFFHTFEVIGEAANRVSPSFRASHPEIPWQRIVAQRNVLAHEYGEIEPALVWRVATLRIPELIQHLQSLLPLLPPQPNGGG